MNSIESIMKTPAFNGTVKEMQLRMLLHDIRQAADEGESEILIPLYKLPVHVPTLEHEILEPAGFKTKKFKDEDTGVQKLCISWR